MDRKRLSELRQAEIERQFLRAQVATRLAVDEIKETSRILRKRTTEVRAHSFGGRPFTVDWTVPRLPRAGTLRGYRSEAAAPKLPAPARS
jgi:hypothetical protein